jgi:hypothetical protein
MVVTTLLQYPKYECHQSDNDCRAHILDNQGVGRRQESMMHLLVAFQGKHAIDDIVIMPYIWASMERQQFNALPLQKSTASTTTFFHNWTLSPFSSQNCMHQQYYYVQEWATTECQRFWILKLWYSKHYRMQLTNNLPIGSPCCQKLQLPYRVRLLQLCAYGVSTIVVQIWQAEQQWCALHCFLTELYAASLVYMTLKWTSQICMQCFTDLIVSSCSSRVNIPEPTYCCNIMILQQSLRSDYPDLSCIPPCWIRSL